MKRNAPFVFLFFLLLIVALIFTAAHQARQDEASTTPAPLANAKGYAQFWPTYLDAWMVGRDAHPHPIPNSHPKEVI